MDVQAAVLSSQVTRLFRFDALKRDTCLHDAAGCSLQTCPPAPPRPAPAVPSRGGTPLPRDPFEMTGEPEGLGSATLQELRVGQ